MRPSRPVAGLRWTTTLPVVLCGLVLSLLLSSIAQAGGWPDFRGPTKDGHSPEVGLPLEWSETPEGEQHNIAWKVDTPYRGFSSPVVLEGKVWLTAAQEEQRSLRALAYDLENGELLIDVEVFRPESFQPHHPDNSFASPSPVAEPGRVWVHYGAYGTACLDASDGKVLWRNNENYIEHEVGPGSSPMLYRHLLIINFDGTDQRYVAALHKETGKQVWRSERSLHLDRKGMHKKAFSTPLVVPFEGKDFLISTGAGQTSAYLPETGLEVWRIQHDGYSNVPRPVAGLGMVFVNSGYFKPHLYAVRLGGIGDVTESHVNWRYHWQVPANPSPILLEDRLYMVADGGVASWLDAHAGKDLWRRRLDGPFWASPVYAEGRIYNFSRDGQSVVMAASDTYEELAVNQLQGTIRASPAVADRSFVIRTTTHLYRLLEQTPPEQAQQSR